MSDEARAQLHDCIAGMVRRGMLADSPEDEVHEIVNEIYDSVDLDREDVVCAFARTIEMLQLLVAILGPRANGAGVYLAFMVGIRFAQHRASLEAMSKDE